MKRFLTTIFALTAIVGLNSCNNDKDTYYISSSGEGSLTIDYNVPIFLGRMVLFSDDDEQMLYLMGGSCYVNSSAEFGGSGAVVCFTMPNSDSATTLEAQSFAVDNSDYLIGYTTNASFSDGDDKNDYTYLESGTVIIRRSGSLYDIQVLGEDSDEDSVIIKYLGYIYRSFVAVEDDTTDDDNNDDTTTEQ